MQHTQIALRWVDTGTRMRGKPEELLDGVDEHTIVSDWLSGPVEAKNLDTIEIKALDQGDRKSRGLGPMDPLPLMYLVDNGEQLFRMPVHQLLRAIDARRKEVLQQNAQESLNGEYLLHVDVNGEHAASEVLRIINPFAGTGKSGGGKAKAGADKRVDWSRDWAMCARSLKYRGIELDPGVQAALMPHAELLQSVYSTFADRRAAWNAEIEAREVERQEREKEEKARAAVEVADVVMGKIADWLAGEVAKEAAEQAAKEAMEAAFREQIAASSRMADDDEVYIPSYADPVTDAPPDPMPLPAPGPAHTSGPAAALALAPAPAPALSLLKKGGGVGKKAQPLLALEDYWDLCKCWKLTSTGDKGSGRPPLTQAMIDALLPSHYASSTQLPPSMRREASNDSAAPSRGYTSFASEASFSSRFSASTVNLVESESGVRDGAADIGSASIDGSATIGFASFLEGLMMASLAKFKGEALASAAEKLVVDHIKRYGVSVSGVPSDVITDPLRDELRHSAECRSVVHDNWEPLLELYRFWADHFAEDAPWREPSSLLTSRDVLAMLEKASVIGKKMSLVTARGLLMNTLFEQRFCGYGNEFSEAGLTYGDLVELLARCAKELLKSETDMTLAEQLQAMIDHCHKTTNLPPSTSLPPLTVEKKKKAEAPADASKPPPTSGRPPTGSIADLTGPGPRATLGSSSMLTTPNLA